MRCLGRTQALRRCRREGDFLFCRDHGFQPYAGLLFIATLIGLAGGIYRDVLEPVIASPSLVKPAVSAKTIEVLGSLADEVSGKSESMLRDEFGFDDMFERNTSFLFARYQEAAFGVPVDLEEYVKPGTSMKILQGGGGIVNMETGAFTPKSSNRNMRYLLLSPLYEKRMSELRTYSDSPFVPETTKAAVRLYLEKVEANIDLLGEILEQASRELPDKYPTSNTPMSHVWVGNRLARRFHDLTPAANAIKYDIAKYVAGEELLLEKSPGPQPDDTASAVPRG